MKKRLWLLMAICSTGLCVFVTACGSGYSKTVYTLTVNSTNPSSGLAISISPADGSSAGDTKTSFTRSYLPGTVVTLTAPATSGNNTFSSWSGCTSSSSVTCSVTLNADMSVMAAYSAAPPLTPTVTMVLSPASITTAQSLAVAVSTSGGSSNPTPTGSIILAGGGYSSPATTLSNGGVTITLPAGSLPVGTDTLTATYTPDAASAPSYGDAKGSATVTVASPTLLIPTVTVAPSPGSITTAQSFTAAVSVIGGSGNPIPTGSIVLTSGSYMSAAAMLSNGNAAITVPAGSVAAGMDRLIATYTPGTASSSTYGSAMGAGTVAVTSSAPPPTMTLTANPVAITAGGSSMLNWKSTDATSCTASGGWSGQNAPSDARIVSPTVTTTYTLTCVGAGGSASASAMVTVNAQSAPTLTLTASPANIVSGASSTLSWKSTDATSCTASGGWSGAEALSSTQLVTPANTTTYGLTCTGSGGSANASATVTINATGTPGIFTLSAPLYNVIQSADSLTVTVNRAGGNVADAVAYATSDGTALAGTDYTATSGILNFAAGDTSQTLVIPISSASPFVGYKTFTVTLSSPGGGATLGTPDSASVSIFGTGNSPNAKSPLGINLNGVTYYTPEQPFLNIFKTNSGWSTIFNRGPDTSEEQYLNLDSDGYPITLTAVNDPSPQKFNEVCALVLRSPTNDAIYPAGQYVVLYDGEGTITYDFDPKKNATLSKPGRDVLDIPNPTGGGILLTITATDPNHTGNYIRNIRIVNVNDEQALQAGQMFNPILVNLLKNYRALRFMDWFVTNGSDTSVGNTLSSWSNRPRLTNYTWASSTGVPIEAAVDLCNTIAADCWLNVPVHANDDYITQMATLVHGMLGPNQNVYVEFSNEVWNTFFEQHQYATQQGQAMWPAGGAQADYTLNWYGMRVAQMCDIWAEAWGVDSGRIHCTMGAQAANPGSATDALNCGLWSQGPCYKHHVTDVAIAPYFGEGNVPLSWINSLAQSNALYDLFTQINSGGEIPGDYPGGELKQVSDWAGAYKKALASYNLPFVAYEGGQGYTSFANWQAVDIHNSSGSNEFTDFYTAANRDSRMGDAYTTYLNQWKSNGGTLFMHYSDISPANQYGTWGALESIMQATPSLSTPPPKWQALQDFIANTPCWWNGCNR